LAREIRRGRWYWEATVPNAAYGAGELARVSAIGIAQRSGSARRMVGTGSREWAWRVDGYKLSGLTAVPFGKPIASGNTFMVALDAESGKMWLGLDGEWFDGGEPDRGILPAFDSLHGNLAPAVSSGRLDIGAATLKVCVYSSSFAHEPPVGFLPLGEAPISGQPRLRTALTLFLAACWGLACRVFRKMRT